jgi:syntaxin-binding protein 1
MVHIIALYILHRDGVPNEDRRQLYQHGCLSLAEQDTANALALLGVRTLRGPGDCNTRKKLRARAARAGRGL